MRQTVFRCATALILTTALGGCALVKGADAPRETYDILAPTTVARTGSTRAQLLVKEPTALKALNSDRIVLKPSPRVITYVAEGQWLDTAPRLVQARLVEAFENTGRTGATAKPGDGLVIDYQLVTNLRRFDIDGRSNEAVMELSVKLLTDRTGKVRDARIFSASVPVGTASADGYVVALDAAFDAVARDVIAWVLRSV